MTSDNPELAMTGLVILILIFCFAIIWFAFMVPMEKGLYKRRMQLLQRKLAEHEERLRRQKQQAEEEGARHDEKRRASGGER